MQALEQWIGAGSHLRQAAQHFFDSCATLEAATRNYPAYPLDQASTEDAILRMQSYLGLLKASQNQLELSQVVLNRVLNRSHALISINKLPDELLSHIFDFVVVPRCRYRALPGDDPLAKISSVCTRWHNVFKQTGSLWSHIDIFAEDWVDVNRPPTTVLVQLQKTKNVPLHVHFGPKDDIKGSEAYLLQVPAIILLNSARICSVQFSRFDAGNMIALMTTLLEISPITRLDLGGTTYLDSSATIGRQWPIHSFHGLIELQISHMADQDCPSLSQLAMVLANSPALQILRLRMMFVHPNANHSPQLVDLPHLRCLDFSGSVGPSHSTQVLSIIGATSSSLYLMVPASKNDPNSSIVAAFLSRSRVASLYIWVADYYDTHLPAYLADARYLRMLILIIDNHDISNYLDELIVSTEHGLSPLLTTLETLYLIGGDIDENDLKRLQHLSSISSLNQLVFAKCSFLQEGNWVEVSSVEQYQELEAPEVKTILQQVPVVMFKEYDTEDHSWDLFLQHETLVSSRQ